VTYVERGLDWLGLKDVVVAVTGAVGGIGQALVSSFVAAGAAVAALDVTEDACRELAEPYRIKGDAVLGVSCDVADESSVRTAAARVRAELGPVGVLVNNAGVARGGAVKDIEIAEWNRVLDINLTGYLLCARSFLPQLQERGNGTIVNIASIGGRLPQGYSGAYSVSKAGVRMLSQVLAVEFAEFGVRSNVISPAMLITPMSEGFYRDPQVKAERESMVPSGRIGNPQDVADVALFLASTRSSYINGEDLLIDGALNINLLAQIPRPGFERPAPQP
jgi:glucose 1-dehydrogenase